MTTLRPATAGLEAAPEIEPDPDLDLADDFDDGELVPWTELAVPAGPLLEWMERRGDRRIADMRRMSHEAVRRARQRAQTRGYVTMATLDALMSADMDLIYGYGVEDRAWRINRRPSPASAPDAGPSTLPLDLGGLEAAPPSPRRSRRRRRPTASRCPDAAGSAPAQVALDLCVSA